MFHKHHLILIDRTYMPPLARLMGGNYQGITARELMGMAGGMTTFLWECSICSKTKTVEMLGQVVSDK